MNLKSELSEFRELRNALTARGVDIARADELAKAEIERKRFVRRRPEFAERHGKFRTDQSVEDRADRLAACEGCDPVFDMGCAPCGRIETDPIFLDTETCSECGGLLEAMEQ